MTDPNLGRAWAALCTRWSCVAVVVTVAAMAAGAAFAHAHLGVSDPAADTVLTSRPATVTLEYTEATETLFSTYKVYALDTDVGVAGADDEELAWLRLNGLAGALVTEVLSLTSDEGAEARVDTGLVDTETTTARVTMGLDPELGAGVYVVMWRVLSVDTHTTQGYFVFEFAPED